VTEAQVDAVPYEDVSSPPGVDALVLSGSADPWASHRRPALDGFIDILRQTSVPTLGICAGMQLLVRAGGGAVGPARKETRGFTEIDVLDDTDLLAGLAPGFTAFQSHEDEVIELPSQFRLLAASASCAVEGVASRERPWWGTQFHPEAWDRDHPAGRSILERFVRLAGVR
jgi:GMP synthase-like glutamine amidotransferase